LSNDIDTVLGVPSLETSDAEIVTRLETFIGAESDGSSPKIVRLRRASLGRSTENWLFDALWDEDPDGSAEPLIVRRDPEGGLVDTDRALEFEILRALESSALPTPRVRWLDETGRWLGRPSLVMRREEGESDYYVLNGDRPLLERVELARRLCDLLAAVHLVPWADLGLGTVLPDPGPEASRVELERFVTVLRNDQLRTYPEIEAALTWLCRHAPASRRTVLVHADFKAGNVLLAGTEITALLDWELAHLGDPLEDLGWVTQPLREREHLIAGGWERDQLVAHYVAATGFDVDPEALHWWQTFATFRTAVMQVSGLRAYVEGRAEKAYRPNERVLATLTRQIGA
jgi:aminoglycoside phosphotransferase (APT) family kinase protein